MLYLLTGEIQTGKTRWLECLVADLADTGVVCYGILSPGIWRERIGADGAVTYEKLGIETVFLPGMQRSVFATRRDLAKQGGACDGKWQSTKAGLGWVIPDEALAAVNRHFDALEQGKEARQAISCFLIIDELGRLELEHGGGFTSAVKLLDTGPTERFTDALIVVREGLAQLAIDRFTPVWGEVIVIHPDDAIYSLFL